MIDKPGKAVANGRSAAVEGEPTEGVRIIELSVEGLFRRRPDEFSDRAGPRRGYRDSPEAGNATPSVMKQVSNVVFMIQGKPFGLSAAQKSGIWRRWKAGQSLLYSGPVIRMEVGGEG